MAPPSNRPKGFAAIGSGIPDKLTKIGSIVPAINGTSARFPIRSLDAQKSLMLHVQPAVDLVDKTNAVANPYGAAQWIKGVRTLVAGQPGPYAMSGTMLWFKNYIDHLRAPRLTVPSVANNANGLTAVTGLFLDFAFPGFRDEDASVLKTKGNKTYEIEVDFGGASDIIGSAVNCIMSAATSSIVDVYAHELPLAPTRNVYNKNYERQEQLAVNSQLRIPLDISSGFLNMLGFQVFDQNGVLSDTVVSSVGLRNGSKQSYRDLGWDALKIWNEVKGNLVSPLTLPVGFNYIDLTANNEFKAMRDMSQNKEMELVFNATAVGSVRIWINLATEPVAGD